MSQSRPETNENTVNHFPTPDKTNSDNGPAVAFLTLRKARKVYCYLARLD